MNINRLEKIIYEQVLMEINRQKTNNKKVPVGVSARHVHLSDEHLEILFGNGYKLTPYKLLSQPGQYASEEKVDLVNAKGKIKNVRILGPTRKNTQVELSKSDMRVFGLKGVVRSSGDIDGTEGITIVGPQGTITISQGVIIADRHIHMTEEDAIRFNVANGDKVNLKVTGKKGGIMSEVSIRVSDNYALDCHIDTDDANAFQLSNGSFLEIIEMEK